MSLLEMVAVILLSSASVLVLWAIRLCDTEPETPAAPTKRNRPDPQETLRRAA